VLVAATALLVGFLLRRKKELTLATKNAHDDLEFDQARWVIFQSSVIENWNWPLIILTRRDN